MRITDNLASQIMIANLSSARDQLSTAQTIVDTGLQFQTAAENPIAASGVMQNNTQLNALTQYKSNTDAATTRVTLEESVLDQINTLLTQAKELAVSQATDTATTATRQAAGEQVNQLLAQAVQLSNTKNGNTYLFGGDYPTQVPFSVDTSGSAYTFTVAANPPSGTQQIEIGSGQRIVANHDGTQVFGTASSGLLKTLQDLAGAMQTGTQSAITGTLDSIDTQINATQSLIGEAGARADQLQITSSNITALNNQITASNSNLQGADTATAMTELVNRQTAYQAALAATSRVMGLSLAQYI
jgi:flagellar hook-associated protein 3 FlgL